VRGPQRRRWRKSSRSTANANCVEVVVAAGAVAVRDSKHPTGGTLIIWTAFTTALRASEFG
jgi:hypothetical protein